VNRWERATTTRMVTKGLTITKKLGRAIVHICKRWVLRKGLEGRQRSANGEKDRRVVSDDTLTRK